MFRDGCPSRAILTCVLALLCFGCRGGHDASSVASVAPADARAPSTPAPPVEPGTDPNRPRIVALGDSLTAGLGLLERQSYPSLLQQKLSEEGYNFDVINSGVSGDTSAAGFDRIDWALDGNVKILIVELGANDGLRGLPVDQMKKNLGAIIQRAQQRGVTVLLLGMEAPPQLGPEYVRSFHQVYRDLARERHVALVPFMLDKVAGNSALNQSDGIHPNIEGTRIVADTIWNALKPLVDAVTVS